jgi:hypothetical protein
MPLGADGGLTGGRAPRLAQRAHHAALVGEHAEDRAGVRARRAQQLKTVGLRPGERLLVRQDDALALRIQTQRAEDPAADQATTTELELVFVQIERVALVADQHALADPVAQLHGGARVLVLRVLVRALAREFDPDEVVRSAPVQALASGLVDDVVGRADQTVQATGDACVVPEAAKGDELGHVPILGPWAQ